MPNLYRVLIPVSDIDGAQRFYEYVLDILGQRVSPGRHYFDCGGTILACFDPHADGEGRSARANPEHLYIAVDDLAATYRRCQEQNARFDSRTLHGGQQPLGEIAERPWGERSFYMYDPFDNPLCFVDATTVFRG